eukprot:TRINITY_DN1776_c0_g1_i1.p2 TRINITY_DN1776_c0_g1~~TRINITY_DN1776_c0_g1_i1.p2  ORF type:complete len:727 (-),score=197.85 TRINITY_DN1776_c0_g1_i1:3105-5285(-)
MSSPRSMAGQSTAQLLDEVARIRANRQKRLERTGSGSRLTGASISSSPKTPPAPVAKPTGLATSNSTPPAVSASDAVASAVSSSLLPQLEPRNMTISDTADRSPAAPAEPLRLSRPLPSTPAAPSSAIPQAGLSSPLDTSAAATPSTASGASVPSFSTYSPLASGGQVPANTIGGSVPTPVAATFSPTSDARTMRPTTPLMEKFAAFQAQQVPVSYAYQPSVHFAPQPPQAHSQYEPTFSRQDQQYQHDQQYYQHQHAAYQQQQQQQPRYASPQHAQRLYENTALPSEALMEQQRRAHGGYIPLGDYSHTRHTAAVDELRMSTQRFRTFSYQTELAETLEQIRFQRAQHQPAYTPSPAQMQSAQSVFYQPPPDIVQRRQSMVQLQQQQQQIHQQSQQQVMGQPWAQSYPPAPGSYGSYDSVSGQSATAANVPIAKMSDTMQSPASPLPTSALPGLVLTSPSQATTPRSATSSKPLLLFAQVAPLQTVRQSLTQRVTMDKLRVATPSPSTAVANSTTAVATPSSTVAPSQGVSSPLSPPRTATSAHSAIAGTPIQAPLMSAAASSAYERSSVGTSGSAGTGFGSPHVSINSNALGPLEWAAARANATLKAGASVILANAKAALPRYLIVSGDETQLRVYIVKKKDEMELEQQANIVDVDVRLAQLTATDSVVKLLKKHGDLTDRLFCMQLPAPIGFTYVLANDAVQQREWVEGLQRLRRKLRALTNQ